MRAFLVQSLVLLLGACGSTQAPITYSPTRTVMSADSGQGGILAMGPVSNERRRGHEDSLWVGTIRGGFGNPLKVLNADRPIDQVIRQAFTDGLAARGLLARTGAEPPYLLMVNIHQFDADQMVRREAWAEFSVRVVDRPTGREVWRDRYLANQVDGSPFALAGVAASLEDLRNTALRTMSEAVDALLDKPEFRAALRH